MPAPTVRERVLRAVQEMPGDASFDDVVERSTSFRRSSGAAGRSRRARVSRTMKPRVR